MPIQEPARLAGQHLHVLGGDAVGFGNQFLVGVAQDDLAVVAPGHAGDVGGRQHASWRSISASMPSAIVFEVVSSIAGEVGPCSAWPSRSVAHISTSAVSSAMISVSVGPASRSMPTRPNSCRLASATIGVAGADQHVDRRRSSRAERPSPRPPGCRRADRSRRRRRAPSRRRSRPAARRSAAACRRRRASPRRPSRSAPTCAPRRPSDSARPARSSRRC